MTALHRHDRLTSHDGRRFIVNSVTMDSKVLLDRLDRQPREHLSVWKNLGEVQDWRRDGTP